MMILRDSILKSLHDHWSNLGRTLSQTYEALTMVACPEEKVNVKVKTRACIGFLPRWDMFGEGGPVT